MTEDPAFEFNANTSIKYHHYLFLEKHTIGSGKYFIRLYLEPDIFKLGLPVEVVLNHCSQDYWIYKIIGYICILYNYIIMVYLINYIQMSQEVLVSLLVISPVRFVHESLWNKAFLNSDDMITL